MRLFFSHLVRYKYLQFCLLRDLNLILSSLVVALIIFDLSHFSQATVA